MKAKEFIPVSKPRNFVVKNQKTAGAGAHKDKKRAEKQGDVKHKAKQFAEGDDPWGDQGRFAGDTKVNIGGTTLKKIESGDTVSYFDEKAKVVDIDYTNNFARIAANGKTLNVKLSDLKRVSQDVAEVSKATIDRYVAKAGDSYGHADFAARMSKDDPTKRSYHVDQKKTAEKRRQGISRALDRMSREESIEEYGDTAKGQKMLTKVQKRAVDRVVSKKADTDPKYAKKNQQTANRAWDRMTGVDEATSVAVRLQRAADKQRAKSDASLARTPSSIPKKEEPKKS